MCCIVRCCVFRPTYARRWPVGNIVPSVSGDVTLARVSSARRRSVMAGRTRATVHAVTRVEVCSEIQNAR